MNPGPQPVRAFPQMRHLPAPGYRHARRERQRLTPNPKSPLWEQVHEVMRFFHLSRRTEDSYWPLRSALFALLWALCALALDLRAAPKPNVLLLMSDDLAATLGCYGHPQAKTPQLDALVERGVLFERAYCQFPHCNPSRASMLSGLRPNTTRVTDNADNLYTNIPGVVTLPHLFRQHGYATARCGKIFHLGVPTGLESMDDPQAWDFGTPFKDERPYPPARPSDVKVKTGKKQGLQWTETTGTDEDLVDGNFAKTAVAWLEKRDKSKPFFLAVGFHRPHLPLVAHIFPSFKLIGLNPSLTCTFIFYGSRSGVSDNRETRYTVTGGNTRFAALNAANNTTNIATVFGITPNSSGEVTVSLAPTANNNNANHFTYLGAMRMDVAALRFLTPAMANGEVILNWTGTGQLQWATDVLGPWTRVTPAPAPPYSEAVLPGQTRFFRLEANP